ncbi:helix-turn-helix domain-containing protein [Flammeovirga sp. EKP202]|uniref:hybrid sensor histidine kinase/response regulator transcription factor n=1 Tax=Flammeovirga sp. EKP202 TaxID=2770592 RepID=UPI00165F2F30|nr:helix-turn-helix domain-containing protein [Flammeovirga sp. EKP202]MBD0404238.1 helix-turn-helix domain-containing protein [Flammeovirga sp. EKP202]
MKLFFKLLLFVCIPFQIWSTPLKLPNFAGAVTNIIQDKEGYLWISSWDGLYKYDGYEITSFSERNYQPLLEKKISALLEHSNGQIWIGTANNGIFIYDKKEDSFTHLTQLSESARSQDISRINSFTEDGNGNVWIGTKENGLVLYHKNEKIFTSYKIKDLGEEFDSKIYKQDLVLSVHYDDRGFIWFGTMQGLGRMNIASREATILSGKSFSGVYSIVKTDNNEIWCSNTKGVFTVNSNKNKLEGKIIDQLTSNNKSYLQYSPSHKNRLWFMTAKKIYSIDLSTQKIETFEGKGFSAIYEDRAGVLWLGTHYGVYFYDLFKKPIRTLLDNDINAVTSVEKIEDKIWIGTITGDLYYNASIDSDSSNRFVQHKDKFGQITGIEEYEGVTWVSTAGKGVFKIDNSSTKIQEQYELWNQIPNRHVMSIANNPHDNSLWLGFWESGIGYYDKANNKFVALNKGKGRKLLETPIVKIYPENDSVLWIGTRGEGLWKMVYDKSFSIIEIEQYNVQTPTMNTSLVSDIIEKDANTLLISTENGLFEFIKNKHHFSQKNIPEKLLKVIITSIVKTKENEIWGTTLTNVFEWNEDRLLTYSIDDGLSNNRYYNASKKLTTKGDILLGGDKGVDFLEVSSFKKNPNAWAPVITKFYLKKKEIHSKEKVNAKVILDDVIQNVSSIELAHDQNTFSFYLSTLNYSKGDGKIFRYKLDGLDKDWIETTDNNHVVTYNGLMPGNYEFTLMASNVDGQWSDQVKTLKIKIIPVWYKSPIAFLFYLCFFVGVTVVIMRWRKKKDLKANQEKYEHLKVLEEKIEYERKVNFFTNLSHELRTPLTLVLGPIEQIAQNCVVEEKYQGTLTVAYRNAQRLLRLTDQIMFLTKSQHGQLKLNIKEETTELVVKEITEAFKHTAKRKKVSYNISTDDKLQKSVFIDRFMFEAVMYNLLSNAFKYNVDNGGVWVDVSTISHEDVQQQLMSYKGKVPQKKSKHYLKVEVKDSGVGINKEDLEIIFDRFYKIQGKKDTGSGLGLAFTKSIIEVMNGIIEVESTPSLGSKFTVLIPSDNDYYSSSEKEEKEQDVISKLLYSETEKLKFPKTQSFNKEDDTTDKDDLILIVEKSRELREYLGSILEQEYKIIFAENGLDAYEKVLKYFPSLIISEMYVEGIDGLQLSEKIKSGEQTKQIPIVLLSPNPDTQERIKALEAGADSFIAKPFAPKHIEVRVNQLLKARTSLLNVEPKKPSKRTSKANLSFEDQVRRIVEKNITEVEFSVPELAKEMNMSNIQFYRKIKTETGMPPVEFVRNIRFQRALELLKTSDLNISEIAYEVGFNDPQYFRRSFKKQFGQTPSQYRKPIK